MANDEHLKILKQGVEVWNQWREKHPEIVPDLSDADLKKADLNGADLREVNLNLTNFFRSNLSSAKLSRVDFSELNFSFADLREADLRGANLSHAQFRGAELSGADLSDAQFKGADFSGANLSSADLGGADFSGALLFDAKLRDADLSGANLSDTHLTRADLTRANLGFSNFSHAHLQDANFANALAGRTTFADTNFRFVKGLESVEHFSPSTIGIDTLYASGGNIPESFLRGSGVPDEFITMIPSIVGARQAIQFYSCFISYSTKDEEFARRLYSRMRDEKLRVWFAPEEMKGGQKLYEQVERAIQVHDRLLIVLSEESMRSEWVITEIRKARKAEIKEKRRKLFPIRLVDFETIKDWECFDADTGKDLAVELREYYMPDFSNWKDHDLFEQAFSRLHRDLKAEESR